MNYSDVLSNARQNIGKYCKAAADQYGCFVPDLTRFLGTACEGTRQAR